MPVSSVSIPAMSGKVHPSGGRFFPLFLNAITPAMLGFDALLISVHAHLLAERELDDTDCWDPACRNWQDDADAAHTMMERCIFAMRGLRAMLPGDTPLLRMSMLLCIMLQSKTPYDFSRARSLLVTHAVLFECTGNDPVAIRISALLRRGRSLIDCLTDLSSFHDANDPFDHLVPGDSILPHDLVLDDLYEAA